MSVSTHAVGVAGHGGPSESVTSSGDIQSILQRAIRPDSSHNSAPSSQSFTIGLGSKFISFVYLSSCFERTPFLISSFNLILRIF